MVMIVSAHFFSIPLTSALIDLRSIQFDSYSIRYLRFGNLEGQPLVIIPSMAIKSVMESADLIEKQYQSFTEAYNVYMINRHMNISDECNIDAMADDVIIVLNSLPVNNADIYGVSQGGMLAQVISINRIDLVRKLVLCSTADRINRSDANDLNERCRLARNQDIDGLMQSLVENIYTLHIARNIMMPSHNSEKCSRMRICTDF